MFHRRSTAAAVQQLCISGTVDRRRSIAVVSHSRSCSGTPPLLQRLSTATFHSRHHQVWCHSGLRRCLSNAATASFAAALSSVVVRGEAHRGFARQPRQSAHDSNDGQLSSTYFDIQDVDADRLTHFYWDRGEDSGSPYDDMLLSHFLSGESDEWTGEGLGFVDGRDHELLEQEYLH